MCDENKSAVVQIVVAISVVTLAAACALLIKDHKERKKIGGRQIRVNYKFSREFDV